MRCKPAIVSVLLLMFFMSPVYAQPKFIAEPVTGLCEEAEYDESYDTRMLNGLKKIVEGKDGWVFTSHRAFNQQFGFHEKAQKNGFHRFVQALKRRGTELVVVYTPPRGLMNYEFTLSADEERYLAGKRKYVEALEQFRRMGVIAPSLDELLGASSDFFSKRDFHWTAEGARLAAKKVAEELIDSEIIEPFTESNFETIYSGLAFNRGSVKQGIQIICQKNLRVQYFKTYQTTMKSSGADLDSSSLFGESDEKNIILIGTSFSALNKFNFSGFLEQYLNTSVSNYAISGGGAIAAWQDYLKSDEFSDSPPDVIIWEVPAYYKLDSLNIYSYLNPLLYDACEQQPVLAQQSDITFKNGGLAHELVFSPNASVPSKNLVVDVQYSDQGILEMSSTIWFGSGGHKDYILKRNSRSKADGRFVFELADDQYGDATVIAIDINKTIMADGNIADEEDIKNLRADMKVCTRRSSESTKVAGLKYAN